MHAAPRALAICFALSVAAAIPSASAGEDPTQLRIRPLTAYALDLVQMARARSPTIRELLDQLQSSDLVVYVDFRAFIDTRKARTVLLNAAGGNRSLLIAINPRNTEDDRIELLGHELEHAIEIAGAPEVIDSKSLARFYAEHGHPSKGGGFETHEANQAQAAVHHEIHEQ